MTERIVVQLYWNGVFLVCNAASNVRSYGVPPPRISCPPNIIHVFFFLTPNLFEIGIFLKDWKASISFF